MFQSSMQGSSRKEKNLDPLTKEVLKLVSDLPIHPAYQRSNIYQPCNYKSNGYMLLRGLPNAEKVFTRNFILKWSNLLRNGPVEKLFNGNYNEFTDERRQVRPLADPKYTK